MNGLTACKRQDRPTGAGAMLAQSVSDILKHHVKLSVEASDRMYLNVYVPRLQAEQGIVRFFREHRGQPLPSAALMSPTTRNFVAALDRFVAQQEIPVVQFRKGQRKDEVMAEHLCTFEKEEGVVFVGKSQEKTRCSAPSAAGARRAACLIHGSCAHGHGDHYYFYAVD